MVPPTSSLNLDVEAISGICGSISIACWVVVFSPQIVENFRRSSAEGLSLQFLVIWLLGDVFNILGAVLQGVLPTMIILAVYYTIADIVLLGQVLYYQGFNWRDDVKSQTPKPSSARIVNERTALLDDDFTHEHRASGLEHLSPAVPLVADVPPPSPPPPSPTKLQNAAFNALAIFMVCTAGVAGWYLSRGYSQEKSDRDEGSSGDNVLTFDLWGQIFGYLCAVFYLGSRLPQLLLNWRRKSTEGVSMLFFLFACLGNLTYVLSIFAYEAHCRRPECEPREAEDQYGRYILVNASWLAGSLGTLLLDLGIFVQFFMYSRETDDESLEVSSDEEDYITDDEGRWERPLLQRNASNYSH